jgi:chromosome segregation ATPase
MDINLINAECQNYQNNMESAQKEMEEIRVHVNEREERLSTLQALFEANLAARDALGRHLPQQAVPSPLGSMSASPR